MTVNIILLLLLSSLFRRIFLKNHVSIKVLVCTKTSSILLNIKKSIQKAYKKAYKSIDSCAYLYILVENKSFKYNLLDSTYIYQSQYKKKCGGNRVGCGQFQYILLSISTFINFRFINQYFLQSVLESITIMICEKLQELKQQAGQFLFSNMTKFYSTHCKPRVNPQCEWDYIKGCKKQINILIIFIVKNCVCWV
eukprot:TRINITY_DN1927_c1_g1_i4.p1 TRINITY_DN1927_c1_g1~~TRINITY_DN1927_c1_g1_i4.p1  ORF type:complete len:210 (+),score=-22.85 TRINITY_DN1927_c1_g1_i4:48-632(+)